MRRSFLTWYARHLVRHPRWILAAGIGLTVASLLISTRLELHTSREDLSDSFHVTEKAYDDFVEQFGSPNTLVVVVGPRDGEAAPEPAEYRAFVDQLAALLASEKEFFSEIFYQVHLDAFIDRGLYYLDQESLRQLQQAVGDVSRISGLADANRLLADRIRRGLEDGVAEPAEGASLGAILPALRWEARFLSEPEASVAALDDDRLSLRAFSRGADVSPQGYLVSPDRAHFFVLAQPSRNTSSMEFIGPLVAMARQRIAAVEADHPRLRAGITGVPGLIQEEMAAIRHDSVLTTTVAALGIILLSFWAFHRVRLAPLVLLSLAMGVVWTAGLITLTIGYLSLITSSFAVILIGLGIDYGVHLVAQYEIERAQGRRVEQALGKTIDTIGPGLLTGAATTSVAFFTITLMEFKGFAQLGFVAGCGVILCLLAMVTVLPAMLAMDGLRRDRSGDHHKERFHLRSRVSEGVLRFPRSVLLLGLLITLLLALQAGKTHYNESLTDQLPARAESVRLQDTLRDSPRLSPDFGVVLAASLDELKRLQASHPDAPAIAWRESILDYLPQDLGERQASLDRLGLELSRLELDPPASDGAPAPEAADLDASLETLENALADVEDLAFAAGRTALLEQAGQALELIGDARAVIASASAQLRQRWQEEEAGLLERARDWRDRLVRMAAQPPPELDDLPEQLRRRFIGRSGVFSLYLYPARHLSEPHALGEFVRDCRRISDRATGPPVLLYEHSEQIRRGFMQAVLLGSLLAAGILFLDFRRPGCVLLAALPTALGILWMLGLMVLIGLEFNLANLIAIPLVLGIGMDNGVHMVHRFVQEGKDGMQVVLQHTGRAILVSSLTTMIGFGSMTLASHRGMSSFGAILFLGIGSVLVTSTLLLPCLL
ncbi:MAG: MMPL family transporter, partial [Acidobacteriota bacterium]